MRNKLRFSPFQISKLELLAHYGLGVKTIYPMPLYPMPPYLMYFDIFVQKSDNKLAVAIITRMF